MVKFKWMVYELASTIIIMAVLRLRSLLVILSVVFVGLLLNEVVMLNIVCVA